MSIKKVIASFVFVFGSLLAAPSYAGLCGVGTITEVREGYDNQEDLLIRLDVSAGAPLNPLLHAGTLTKNVFIRFKAASLTPDRLQSLRALAYLGLVTGKSVYAWTHSKDESTEEPDKGGCSDATELSVASEGVDQVL